MKIDSKMTIQELMDYMINGNARYAAEKLEEEGESPVEIYSDLLWVCDCLEQATKRLHSFLGHYIVEKGITAADCLKLLGRD